MGKYGILIDILTNSMESMVEEEFINNPDLTNFFSTEELTNIWNAYWKLDGMKKFSYDDGDWAEFIMDNVNHG